MAEEENYEQLATPAERQSWAKQNNLMYGGMIAIGVVILQGFLTADPLDIAGKISVIGFAVALPLLAVLILLGDLQTNDPSVRSNITDEAIKPLALFSSLSGVVAAFWHIDWLPGVIILVTGVLALGVYGSHFTDSRFGRATLRRRLTTARPH
ncbi:hypothetical protein [Nocardia sp. NPDC052566]|uniref:hypothetical protein n=1 Tax=Nocardia sp. NPDC052566 TaxID=3364330 RepID=UPI0037C8F186